MSINTHLILKLDPSSPSTSSQFPVTACFLKKYNFVINDNDDTCPKSSDDRPLLNPLSPSCVRCIFCVSNVAGSCGLSVLVPPPYQSPINLPCSRPTVVSGD